MSDTDPTTTSPPFDPTAGGTVHLATEKAVAATHPPRPAVALPVAPATAQQSNLLASAIFPIACWRVEELLFDFDSSFVRADGREEMRALKDLRERHGKAVVGGDPVLPPISIFGHADPVGSDDYNKQLSGRRAQAIYALLVRDVAMWETLFSQSLGNDKWGNAAIRTMIVAVKSPPPAAGSDPAAAGNSNTNADSNASDNSNSSTNSNSSSNSSSTTSGTASNANDGAADNSDPGGPDDIKAFQAANGLGADGIAGPATRKVLFQAYMDHLCGEDFVLDKKADFLAQGADAGGKGDYQGCSEFNPVLMFSADEQDELSQPENEEDRDAENEPNRRVVVFLFRPGAKVTADFWPCPRASEGVAACKKRFWSDADKRRSFQENHRERPKDTDTFACRFYDRLAGPSPCETVSPVVRIRLYDSAGEFMAGVPFRLTIEGLEPRTGFSDNKGFVTARGVPTPAKCVVEWGPTGGKAPQSNVTNSPAAADIAAGDPDGTPTTGSDGTSSTDNTTGAPGATTNASDGTTAAPKTAASTSLAFRQDVILDLEADEEAEAQRRLHNLGFGLGEESATDNIASFQDTYGDQFGLSVTGVLDPDTRDAIRQVHDGVRDNIRTNKDD